MKIAFYRICIELIRLPGNNAEASTDLVAKLLARLRRVYFSHVMLKPSVNLATNANANQNSKTSLGLDVATSLTITQSRCGRFTCWTLPRWQQNPGPTYCSATIPNVQTHSKPPQHYLSSTTLQVFDMDYCHVSLYNTSCFVWLVVACYSHATLSSVVPLLSYEMQAKR